MRVIQIAVAHLVCLYKKMPFNFQKHGATCIHTAMRMHTLDCIFLIRLCLCLPVTGSEGIPPAVLVQY